VPDEPTHFAYVQQLAETGTLPTSKNETLSQEQIVVMRDLSVFGFPFHPRYRAVEPAPLVFGVRFNPQYHPIETQAQQRRLEHDLALPLGRVGGGGVGGAYGSPPLFYALQTIPYGLGSGGSLLTRLELMRLLSALMGGLTALFAYLFVREALPGAPWAWCVGGLGVALAPLLGLMSGAVNPDAMLAAVAAAVFYLLARAFRRGLTPGLAGAIGTATAIGTVTKLNFLGLAPGILVGLIVLARRGARTSRHDAYRSLALALGIAATPVCVYILINLLSDHAGLGTVSNAINTQRGSVFHDLSYIWQLFLPRLPGMTTYFPGVSTSQLWFDRSVGLYGWLDTPFPVWVASIALIPAVAIAIFCIRALVTVRAALRRRLAELAVYAMMGVGLLALIGAESYLVGGFKAAYVQPRYLLPLLSLGGAVLVLAARGAGRRWGPPAGALIVVLVLAHDVFSQLQVISRFYG
jgi:4-amino-4-deoxy-L-arabinose transferase-like glycosyltransferase